MVLQTGRSVQLSNTPADLSAFVRSETRRTIERNSFEIPATELKRIQFWVIISHKQWKTMLAQA